MSITVAVLFGGQSSEYPVSLMSAASVLNNLSDKYDKYLVGISQDGRWYHYQGDYESIEADKWLDNPANEEVIFAPNHNHHGFYQMDSHTIKRVDVILPILHGRNGEDGTISSIAQLSGIPVVCNNHISCAISMDKAITHTLCEARGIPMAKWLAYYKGIDTDYSKMYEEVEEKLGLPCYVKPTKEGSSFGAHKVRNYEDFISALDDAFSYDSKILVEEFIEGIEVGCGVKGEGEVGEVFEIIVNTEMYGYAEKYDGYQTTINTPALSLTEAEMDEVKRLSKIIYHLMDCDVMARVDFFFNKGKIVFNELNLIPGFTSHSLFPASMKAKGMSYSELLDSLIESVI